MWIAGISRRAWDWISPHIADQPAIDSRVAIYQGLLEPDPANIDHWSKRFQGTYELLGILNDKAEALMGYNGIILAVMTWAASEDHRLDWLEKSIIFMTLISILCCLLVVGIFWGFLERAVGAPRTGALTNGDRAAFADELADLRKVLALRQGAYQLAWWLASLVLLLMLCFFALRQ
jgi:hypothetical protein